MKTLLLGDLSPTLRTDPLFKEGNIDALFGDMVSLFEGNQINFVNLECALTENDQYIEKFGPPLKACPEVADVLKKVGVTCCGLSNNHIFDFGIRGAEDTKQNLDRVGIDHTGFGTDYADSRKNYIVEQGGERICIIAVCEHEYSYALEDRMGSRPYDEYETMEDIRKAKESCDRVIVIYHGGKEHCQYPSPRLLRLCHAMAKNGADVVLCQHSHCIGCYEQYEGCHILYGQGNFHFVKPDFAEMPETWDSTLAVKYDTVSNEIEFIPLVVEGDGMALAKGKEKQELMDAFCARNQTLADGSWKEGWHAFCLSMRDFYVKSVADAFAPGSTEEQDKRFGHYLDCEAHTDVWRELFKTANHTNEK